MRAPSCVLAIVVAATAAGCDRYPYGTRGYDYGPSFDRVPGYQPGYTYKSAADGSKWDYYRNYQGTLHPGPEKYP
jgi:hypothetical protein